jgi:hypothetical protein
MSLTNPEVRDLQWRKSRRSVGNGACVEVAPADKIICVRDSKNPGGISIGYPEAAWQQFLSSAKKGDFDLLSRSRP